MQEISGFTPIYEDLAVVVNQDLPVAQVLGEMEQAGRPLLKRLPCSMCIQVSKWLPTKRVWLLLSPFRQMTVLCRTGMSRRSDRKLSADSNRPVMLN